MCLLNVIEEQSKDIANGVWVDHDDDNLGAGDQVWLGYLCITTLQFLGTGWHSIG